MQVLWLKSAYCTSWEADIYSASAYCGWLVFLGLLVGRELFPLISYKHSTNGEPNWHWLRLFLDLETKLESEAS